MSTLRKLTLVIRRATGALFVLSAPKFTSIIISNHEDGIKRRDRLRFN
jgi:hypothetical protein